MWYRSLRRQRERWHAPLLLIRLLSCLCKYILCFTKVECRFRSLIVRRKFYFFSSNCFLLLIFLFLLTINRRHHDFILATVIQCFELLIDFWFVAIHNFFTPAPETESKYHENKKQQQNKQKTNYRKIRIWKKNEIQMISFAKITFEVSVKPS